MVECLRSFPVIQNWVMGKERKQELLRMQSKPRVEEVRVRFLCSGVQCWFSGSCSILKSVITQSEPGRLSHWPAKSIRVRACKDVILLANHSGGAQHMWTFYSYCYWVWLSWKPSFHPIGKVSSWPSEHFGSLFRRAYDNHLCGKDVSSGSWAVWPSSSSSRRQPVLFPHVASTVLRV